MILRRSAPILLIAVCAAAVSACGATEADRVSASSGAIIGGRPSTSTDFPSAGVLLLRATFGQMVFASPLCTGTLVAPDVVMTAGHCTTDVFGLGPAAEYYFSFELDVSQFGMSTTDLPADAKRVSKLQPHEMFDINMDPGPGLGQWYDVGIAFLAEPELTVTPAVVADAQDGALIAVDSAVDIAGYGQTDPVNQAFGIKNNAATVVHEVSTWEMQIGDLPPTPQKCHGDSGGPTYMTVNDNRFPEVRVIGITSRAYDDSDCMKGGVDSRADAYRSWFETQMIAACNDGTRAAAECAAGGGLPLPSGTPPMDAGVADTGVPPDSGVLPDSGVPPDSGVEQIDADVTIDSGVVVGDDAGTSSGADGGVIVHSVPGAQRETGCSCSTTSPLQSSSALSAILLLAALAMVRKRSR